MSRLSTKDGKRNDVTNNEVNLLNLNYCLNISELENDELNEDEEYFRSFRIILNRIGETAFDYTINEYETFFDYIIKVYRIMFYTRLVLLINVFYLLFHGYIAFIGI